MRNLFTIAHNTHGLRPYLLAAVAAGVLLLAIAVGCGAGGNPTPANTTGQKPDAAAVLHQSMAEILRLESAAFTLEHLKGTTTLFPGLEMSKVYGVADIPDRFSLTVEAESVFPRSFVEIKIVVIEDQAYMTNPGNGRWGEVPPESLPFTLSNLGRTLADIIEAVSTPTLAGSERLNGYDTNRVQGRIRSEDLAELVPGAGEGFDVGLDLWLEQSSGLLLQVRITGMVVPTDVPDTVRQLTLDDINVPVEISPPE